jgi:glutamyl-tRNA reductase
VRSHTAIGETAASVGSVAATLARDVLGALDGRRVLVIGAGKTSELVAVNLLARGAAGIRVANRTVARAEELALKLGGDAVPIEDLPAQLAWADAVITATNAPHWIIGSAEVEAARAERPERPLVLIDLAVPRDIDPAARTIEGVTLLDLDDLERVVETNRSLRTARGADGQAIVAAEAERFLRWRSSLDVVPTIASLRALGEHIRAAELARVDGRWEALSERDRELVDRVTRSIVAKLLHEPTVRIKDLASTEDAAELAQTLARIFPLEVASDPAPAAVEPTEPVGGQAA